MARASAHYSSFGPGFECHVRRCMPIPFWALRRPDLNRDASTWLTTTLLGCKRDETIHEQFQLQFDKNSNSPLFRQARGKLSLSLAVKLAEPNNS